MKLKRRSQHQQEKENASTTSKKILALDIAQKCGWATLINGKIESGVVDLGKKPGESNGMVYLRFNKFLYDMNALACTPTQTYLPEVSYLDYIIYEKPFWRGSGSSLEIGMVTRVEEFGDSHGCDYSYVAVSTLKKFVTGNGRANKEVLMRHFQTERGRPPVDDNESDAYWILRYGMKEIGVE